MGRTLKEGMLGEVRQAVFVGMLVARAGVHHQSTMRDARFYTAVYTLYAVW